MDEKDFPKPRWLIYALVVGAIMGLVGGFILISFEAVVYDAFKQMPPAYNQTCIYPTTTTIRNITLVNRRFQ